MRTRLRRWSLPFVRSFVSALHLLTPSARTIGRWIHGVGAAAVVALSLNAGVLTGQAPQFTPISVGDFIQAVHIIEMRAAIDALRAKRGLAPYPWMHPLGAGAVVRAADVAELRTAISDMFAAAGKVPPVFTDSPLTPGVTVIRARHLSELHSAVSALDSNSPPGVSLASPGNGMV